MSNQTQFQRAVLRELFTDAPSIWHAGDIITRREVLADPGLAEDLFWSITAWAPNRYAELSVGRR